MYRTERLLLYVFAIVALSSTVGCALNYRCLKHEGRSSVEPLGKSSQDERYIDVVMGFYFGCGLRQDGEVRCWGGQPSQNPVQGPFRKIVAGSHSACGLRPDGQVSCWSSGFYPAPSGEFQDIAGGFTHYCGLRVNGEVECWGTSVFTVSQDQGPFTEMAIGRGTICLLRDNGSISCAGYGVPGIFNPPRGRFKAISMGPMVACAIRDTGALVCWGHTVEESVWTKRQQLPFVASGEQSLSDSATAGSGTQVARGLALRNIGANAAERGVGTGMVLGASLGGLIGPLLYRSAVRENELLHPPAGDFVTVRVGLSSEACAQHGNGRWECWGRIRQDPTMSSECQPQQSLSRLSVGISGACAIGKEDSRILCWGLNMYDQCNPQGTQ